MMTATQFTTGGHTVYHLQSATVDETAQRAIISASYDGWVLCHSMSGQLRWQAQTSGHFPFDLCVSDIDGDGFDEALVASSDGHLYALDHDGRPLWKFYDGRPMISVNVVHSASGVFIFCGGAGKTLFCLSPDGSVRWSSEVKGVVRLIGRGCYREPASEIAAVVTMESCRGPHNKVWLNLYDGRSAEPAWADDVQVRFEVGHTTDHDLAIDTMAARAVMFHAKVHSLTSCDANGDGLDEIVLSHSYEEAGRLSFYDGLGREIPSQFRAPRRFAWAYRMNLLAHVRIPDDDFFVGLYGNELILYNPDGSCREILVTSIVPAAVAFDQSTSTLCLGSSISGGDSISPIDLSDPKWRHQFEGLQPIGKAKDILENLQDLREKLRSRRREDHAHSTRPLVIVNLTADEVATLAAKNNCNSIDIASYEVLTEKIPPDWPRDSRMSYDLSREQIIDFASDMESRGHNFAMWAGHGGSFYMTLETLEGVLKAAPKTCKAFVFAEMWPKNPPIVKLIEERMRPLAELCLAHGRKRIVLRNQRLFWNAFCYLEHWKNLIFDPRYKDIFVPAMEETHCRTQDMSLSARVGLWLAGGFEHHAGRAVQDNATFSRLWEWSCQEIPHHHLRTMALHAALGADMFLVNLPREQMKAFSVFLQVLDKGLVKIPRREELLSVNPVSIGMQYPSENFFYHGDNAHHNLEINPESETAVFDRMDWFWGGAPIREDDLCRYGFGSDARMLNYLPRNPHGFIASIPDETDISRHAQWTRKFSTDGEYFYDDGGKQITASGYRPTVESALVDGAQTLPIRVEGEVSWAAARLDDNHIRVTLVDSGYLDPADRDATIVLQRVTADSATDALTGAFLPIENSRIPVHVPVGLFAVVDIATNSPLA